MFRPWQSPDCGSRSERLAGGFFAHYTQHIRRVTEGPDVSKVFLIRNQQGQYATRKGEWMSGREIAQVASFAHHDQALNQLFELGLRAIDLRGRVVEVKVQENGKPLIEDFGPEPEPTGGDAVSEESGSSTGVTDASDAVAGAGASADVVLA
jgi:hypothetical protein